MRSRSVVIAFDELCNMKAKILKVPVFLAANFFLF